MRYFRLCSAYRITSNIAAMKVKFGMPVAYMVWAEQRAIETIGSTHVSSIIQHLGNRPEEPIEVRGGNHVVVDTPDHEDHFFSGVMFDIVMVRFDLFWPSGDLLDPKIDSGAG